jgi:Flp pilus assembly protein TadG
MKKTLRLNIISGLKNHRGVTVIVVALAITMLIGFAALAVDIGYMLVAKNELQNTADAAALATARKLGKIYEGMSYADQQDYDCSSDLATIKQVAKDVALENRAAGENIAINDDDITVGTWDAQEKDVVPNPDTGSYMDQPDAVEVVAKRAANAATGPIITFFARIFGVNTADVSAEATAALTGQSTGKPGLPVGISKERFKNGCGGLGFLKDITFAPTSDPNSCGGWNTFTEKPASASKLKDILVALKNGTYPIPEVTAGDTMFTFTGGVDSTLFECCKKACNQDCKTVGQTSSYIKLLFDTMRVKNDGVLDADEEDGTWTTTVPVYDANDCKNPTGSMLIVGFATVTITSVDDVNHEIKATILCDYVDTGHGSGGTYGNKGSIPTLVQ